MALWKRQTREEILAWFAALDDETLVSVWRYSRDGHFPETLEENFICRSCRHYVPGVACDAPESLGVKSYKDCENAVSENAIHWLSRMKDPFVEEGRQAWHDGYDKTECPYDEGTDGQFGWIQGWEDEDGLRQLHGG